MTISNKNIFYRHDQAQRAGFFFTDPVQGMRMRLFEVVEKCREKCRKL